MGLRFRKSIRICKGVNVNLSTSGVGVSVKSRGVRYSIHSSGRNSGTVSIPGTGLSYTSDKKSWKSKTRRYQSAAHKKQKELEEKKKAAAAADAQKQNALKVEEFENYLDLIRSVHKECMEPIDWEAVRTAPPPFPKDAPPRTMKAQAALDAYAPHGLGKLFKGSADKQREKLEAALEAAKQEDAEELGAWQESVDFAARILKGDTDAYLEALEEAEPFSDFADYGSDLEFGSDTPGAMEIEFRVKSREVVPEKALSLTKTGKLSEREMTKTQYYDLTQDYVCSAAVRLARELFAVLPVERVIVHAVDGVLDTSTGRDTEETILSAEFTREGFSDIVFERIDPSDFVMRFPTEMKFGKTTGFSPVERIEL
ncbi:MAG: DUF4236 domain-containing protein [Oscillospiraceae bacterium]|nr:DUF4236 domain-containing protein [Oscillospiraceae bacterium]